MHTEEHNSLRWSMVKGVCLFIGIIFSRLAVNNFTNMHVRMTHKGEAHLPDV
uniref:Uncharacterized protein n=1 Tax=Anguilla anguilla TaxID=7936 RepID=A0A0E9SZN3_ANGAN